MHWTESFLRCPVDVKCVRIIYHCRQVCIDRSWGFLLGPNEAFRMSCERMMYESNRNSILIENIIEMVQNTDQTRLGKLTRLNAYFFEIKSCLIFRDYFFFASVSCYVYIIHCTPCKYKYQFVTQL